MATIAACSQPVEITTVPSVLGTIRNNVFPTPPISWGVLTDLDIDPVYSVTGLTAPYYLIGAVYPESPYLEPTIGQIWPRIG